MSDKVYGFCDAGCKREVVSKEDVHYQKLAQGKVVAEKAVADEDGNNIKDTYKKKTEEVKITLYCHSIYLQQSMSKNYVFMQIINTDSTPFTAATLASYLVAKGHTSTSTYNGYSATGGNGTLNYICVYGGSSSFSVGYAESTGFKKTEFCTIANAYVVDNVYQI